MPSRRAAQPSLAADGQHSWKPTLLIAPNSGGDPYLAALLIAIHVIQVASTVQANIAFGSMVADTIDEQASDREASGGHLVRVSLELLVGPSYGPYVAVCGIFSVWRYPRHGLRRERRKRILKMLDARCAGHGVAA